ncbi:MAG: PP2C family protein-serine/threonine phosphatase [Bacteroidota bacterium]
MADESTFFKLPLFRELPHAELVRLVQELPVVEYEPRAYLFREGELGESLCIVASGSLEVLLAADTADEMLLRVCGPGEYVGEMSLIMPEGARTATIRAREKARVWIMSRQKFDEVLRRWPVVAYTMVRILSERLDATNAASFHDLVEKNHALQKAYYDLKAAQAQLVEKERLERELQVAAEIQLSILPDQLPETAFFDFGARMLPARQVGGDFYDIFPVTEKWMGVLIGDVADKGVPSALFMARTHALVMAEADTGLDAGQVMQLVNRHITRLEKSTQFVTALYGLLDYDSGDFAYARAGHEPPLLLSSDGVVERLPYGPGMSLGMWDRIMVDQATICLPAGSTLLLYTDGMTDCRDPEGVAFGLDRIKSTLGGLAGLPAQQVCDRLLDTLRDYQQGASQDDDVTLVAVHSRRQP